MIKIAKERKVAFAGHIPPIHMQFKWATDDEGGSFHLAEAALWGAPLGRAIAQHRLASREAKSGQQGRGPPTCWPGRRPSVCVHGPRQQAAVTAPRGDRRLLSDEHFPNGPVDNKWRPDAFN